MGLQKFLDDIPLLLYITCSWRTQINYIAVAIIRTRLIDINKRILNRVGERLNIDSHRWVSILETWGNSSAASLPTAMSIAAHAGGLKPGQKILLSAVGAGMVEAAAVLDWTAPTPGTQT